MSMKMNGPSRLHPDDRFPKSAVSQWLLVNDGPFIFELKTAWRFDWTSQDRFKFFEFGKQFKTTLTVNKTSTSILAVFLQSFDSYIV